VGVNAAGPVVEQAGVEDQYETTDCALTGAARRNTKIPTNVRDTAAL